MIVPRQSRCIASHCAPLLPVAVAPPIQVPGYRPPRAAYFLVVLHISYLGCTGRASDRWRSPTASTLVTGAFQRCTNLHGANPSSDLVFGALILGQAKGCQPSITLSAIGRALSWRLSKCPRRGGLPAFHTLCLATSNNRGHFSGSIVQPSIHVWASIAVSAHPRTDRRSIITSGSATSYFVPDIEASTAGYIRASYIVTGLA